jgi:hypothetical protein
MGSKNRRQAGYIKQSETTTRVRHRERCVLLAKDRCGKAGDKPRACREVRIVPMPIGQGMGSHCAAMSPNSYPTMGPQSDVLAFILTNGDGHEGGTAERSILGVVHEPSKRRSRGMPRRLAMAQQARKSGCQSAKAALRTTHQSGETGSEKIMRSTYVVQQRCIA